MPLKFEVKATGRMMRSETLIEGRFYRHSCSVPLIVVVFRRDILEIDKKFPFSEEE